MQNVKNHTRHHPLYHYLIVPTSLLLVLGAVYGAVLQFNMMSIMMVAVTVLIHLVAFVARDYAKKNQDRIIRVELRLRYFRLTGSDLLPIEQTLSKDQLVALRFADDDQFIEFVNREDILSLTSTSIKSEIKNWRPDLMRV